MSKAENMPGAQMMVAYDEFEKKRDIYKTLLAQDKISREKVLEIVGEDERIVRTTNFETGENDFKKGMNHEKQRIREAIEKI